MEGADMLMVKPGLPYLDVVRKVKDEVSECIKFSVINNYMYSLTNFVLLSFSVSRFTISNLSGIHV
jgi:delta-aminolevulinic acid dehydratase/porphobilinogen synthase